MWQTEMAQAQPARRKTRAGAETALRAMGLKPTLARLTVWRILQSADAPLADGLLPFKRLRLSSADLAESALPASHILIVENEQSLHQLPRQVPDTIAIFGAGLDLNWLSARWLKEKSVAYWGDMDTWGLAMLSRARQHLPELRNLLMERATFDAHAERAVEEKTHSTENPANLLEAEIAFYPFLKQQPKGRLEQEFLNPAWVHEAVLMWRGV